MNINKYNFNKNFFYRLLLFFFSVYTFHIILKGGLYSDYVFRFGGAEQFFGKTAFEDIVLNKRLNLGIFLSLAIALLDPIYIKIIHFFIYFLFPFQIYRISKKLFKSKNEALFTAFLFFIFIQYSGYLDPFMAWPSYGFEFLLILEFLNLNIKIFNQKKINFFYLIFVFLITAFFAETSTSFFLVIIPVIILTIIREKKISKKNKQIIFVTIFLIILYILISILINYLNPNTGYVGSTISLKYPDTFLTFILHFVRSLPLTVLLINQDYLFFFNRYILTGFYYPILFLSLLYVVCIFKIIKEETTSRLAKKDLYQDIFFLIISFSLISIPSALMGLSERYQNLNFEGLGHAHYVVFLQSIGSSLIVSKIIIFLIQKIKKKIVLYLAFMLIGVIFYLNNVHHHHWSKNMYAHHTLYPFDYFSNLGRLYAKSKKIDLVIFSDNEYQSWWQFDQVFTRLFGQKLKVYGNFEHSRKLAELKNIDLSKNNILIFDNFIFRRNYFYSDFCYLKKGSINKNILIDQIQNLKICKKISTYYEKRILGYIKYDSKLILR
jgi:hypothetical protein